MGMYDIIMVTQRCPYCNKLQTFECQTKDLDNLMYEFHPLDDDWENSDAILFARKDFREGFPVVKDFPLDKDCWTDQAEYIEARATLPEEFKNLEYVEVIATCESMWCMAHARLNDKKTRGYISGFGRLFEGKIKIKDGKLIGEIYDLVLDNQPEFEELKFLEELK